ncbi:Cytochrome P450 [Quillaja saponaria]|uniref:Cytochrome P450 n=1 Tax=Quillaja saponaria TaxID=32244 RepID=A0AAD7QGN4_QUISA|nr:Cytochrome P450 [Quillaja saponaria]
MATNEIQSRLVPLLAMASSNDTVLDLQDVFRRFSFDNICKFSFGLDPGCLELSLPVSGFAVAFDEASRLSAERAMTPSPIVWNIKRLLNIGSEKKLKKAIGMVNDMAEQMIKQRPGRDTVAAALTSFFYLLSQNPEVESLIRDELDRVMKPVQEFASFEQMREMHYLNAAVHESMRLYPPIQFDSKFSLEDDVLPDSTFVRKGTRVTYHPYAMGRMERIWGPDCLEFKPDRWLKDGVFVQECPFKYPVFQAGVRVCLGKEMSLTEMKSVAVVLVRRFDIRVAGSIKELRFATGLTATVRGGFPVRVQERGA